MKQRINGIVYDDEFDAFVCNWDARHYSCEIYRVKRRYLLVTVFTGEELPAKLPEWVERRSLRRYPRGHYRSAVFIPQWQAFNLWARNCTPECFRRQQLHHLLRHVK